MKVNKGWKIKRKPSKKIVHSRTISKVDDHTLGIQERVTLVHTAKSIIDYLPGGKFAFFSPEPDDLLLVYAESRISLAEEIKKKFEESRKFNHEIMLSADQDEIFDDLILNLISVPIIIHSALEAFANQQIFYNKIFLFRPGWKIKDGVFYDHYGVQRFLSLEKKIIDVIPKVTFKKISKEDKDKTRKIIQKLAQIRNRTVHQKAVEGEENAPDLIEDILVTDWSLLLKEIRIIMEKYRGHSDAIPTEDLSKR